MRLSLVSLHPPLASALVRNSIEAMKDDGVEEVRALIRLTHTRNSFMPHHRLSLKPNLTTWPLCHCTNLLALSARNDYTVFTSTAKMPSGLCLLFLRPISMTLQMLLLSPLPLPLILLSVVLLIALSM